MNSQNNIVTAYYNVETLVKYIKNEGRASTPEIINFCDILKACSS